MDRQSSLGRNVLDKLDGWASALVTPALPLRVTPEGANEIRLEFRQQIPHSVMLGKLVRAVSGLHGAMLLAESGYITECASILRIVGDFCTEISAIGFALHQGGELPEAIKNFVDQYFQPRARTPDEFLAKERTRYVSREALMKFHKAFAEGTQISSRTLDESHRFVNMAYDSYVHGSYETAMELWSTRKRAFEMQGHTSEEKRSEFVEAVLLGMHEVVAAIELIAAVTAHKEVFEEAREARRAMDAAEPWKFMPV